jgi:hypothetical protein
LLEGNVARCRQLPQRAWGNAEIRRSLLGVHPRIASGLG